MYATLVSFDNGQQSATPDIDVLSLSNSSVSLRTRFSSANVENIDTRLVSDNGTEVFSLLSLGEFTHTHDIGKPKLPVITTVLDVPHGAQVVVRILDVEVSDITLASIGIDKRILPALESVSKSTDGPAHFVINEETYRQDAYYPTKMFEVEEHEGYARGHRLATLRIFPIHYNPIAGMLRVYRSITIEVNFINTDIVATKNAIARHYSPVWEEYIQSMVVNYPGFLRDIPPLPVYYDIMYHSAFSAAAESLANWKTKKGYKVRMWNAAGWTAQQIGDTIEAQVPLATFLVVMGDPNASTPLPPSGTGSSTYDQTDLYYAETDGSGYLPDLYNARIAVHNATQAQTVVDKAIRYEHANFGSAGFDWLKKACLIAGYDPYGNQATGMATNWYCRNILVGHRYEVDTLVCSSGEQEGRVVNQINAGRAWCVYTAHGNRTEWSVGYSGNFNVSELTDQTSNLDMYPMPCGHCCLAADYQYSVSCFGETWDRLSGRGGICYFGSVPSTYWDEDDWLQRRYFDALYTNKLFETGRFTQWALYWIYNNTSTSLKRYYFEAYHIFNDPSLDFWTDIPVTMEVTHDPSVAPDTQVFTVTECARLLLDSERKPGNARG
jgi:gingipain K